MSEPILKQRTRSACRWKIRIQGAALAVTLCYLIPCGLLALMLAVAAISVELERGFEAADFFAVGILLLGTTISGWGLRNLISVRRASAFSPGGAASL